MLKSLVVYDDKGGVGGLSLPGREPLKQAFKDLPFDESRSPRRPRCSRRSRARRSPSAAAVPSPAGSSRSKPRDHQPERRQGHDPAHARDLAHRPRPAAIHPGRCREPAIRRRRCATRSARRCWPSRPTAPRRRAPSSCRRAAQGKRTVRVAYIVEAPVWKASYRLTLPAMRRRRLGAAGLGHGREPERPGLEGRRADAGLGPARRLPSGAVRGLLRHAAGSSRRGGGPSDAQRRSRRRQCRQGRAAAAAGARRRTAIGRQERSVASGIGAATAGRRPPSRSRRRMPPRRSSSSSRGR